MRKSKKVMLTLLSAIALATLGCDEEPKHDPNPYDQYSYAGKSGDEGMSYMHYDNGLLNYYLISRMFDGYGYRWNMPYYSPRFMRDRVGYRGGGFVPHVYSGYARSSGGVASAHSSIGRGGFGGTGMSHGIGG